MTERGPGPFGFPIMVDVRDRPVFVAGGGREAAAKATTLAALGARVTVWADVHRETQRLAERRGIVLIDGAFEPAALDGACLAIVGTGRAEVDRPIAAEARARGVLVNTVDDIPLCDWSAPAILRRGDLTIAIGTAGYAPALAARLRDRLRNVIGPEYGHLLDIFREVRPRVIASGRSFADRRRLWYELVDGPALEQLRAGRVDDARRSIDGAIAAWEAPR
jgi:precorrin-2 dehydrogenase/sirohydrochlorin ferrochelatase